jgi:cytochrome c oxidase cbb3-type subunit 3
MKYALGRGRSGYASHCAACHGDQGQGDAARGIPNLADSDWLYGSGEVSDIERVVDYGIRSANPQAWNLASMPAYARIQPSKTEPKIPPLKPGEIRDVVEFLRYLQRQDADPAAVSRGAMVFSNTGGCYDCHGADAKGDSAIGAPNLTDRITLYGDGSAAALFDSIAHGRQGLCPAWVRKISPAGVREIALYVYSLSHPPAGAPSPHGAAPSGPATAVARGTQG